MTHDTTRDLLELKFRVNSSDLFALIDTEMENITPLWLSVCLSVSLFHCLSVSVCLSVSLSLSVSVSASVSQKFLKSLPKVSQKCLLVSTSVY